MIKSFKIEKIIVKRYNREENPEHLKKWFEYKSQNDFWRSLQKLNNVMKFVEKFDNVNTITFQTHKRFRKNNLT